MTCKQFVKAYCSLSEAKQIALLTQLAADLTVEARDTYEVGTDRVRDGERLREFNEFQHLVLFHVVHLQHHDAKRYPDQVIAETIWEYSAALSLPQLLSDASGSPREPKKKNRAVPA